MCYERLNMTLEQDVVDTFNQAANAARGNIAAPDMVAQMAESITAGTVEALRLLARTIDAQDRRIKALERTIEEAGRA